MHLKSLTLRGFKSFADTTTLDLEPGITVVVGPNGSGKSNVVDAVAWVLGAQGPRTLRSTKMDDVIFAGTTSRPALGRAEVSLTIDNASGILPIDFAEVTISRTLFRNGASDYAINQVPCRLLDIQELLSDSGVGRTQHVIVGQGQLDAVLEARPEERRAIIEEAAGVLKYRRRKEKAERRLASTEANLVRLSDLAREVRRQLRPLERQAEAAQRHGDLVAELDAIRLHLAGRELASLAARRMATEESRSRLGVEEGETRAELASLEVDVEAAQRELMAAGDEGPAELLARVERLREQARGQAAVLAERCRGAARDRAATMDETVVATLEDEASRLRAELEETEKSAGRLAPDVERLVQAEASLAAEVAGLERPDEVSLMSDGEPDPVARAREAKTELAAVSAAVERGQAELARARLRSEGLRERQERLATERQELSSRLDRARIDHD
ncbi:MAG: AAA family ATPase, partial [Actinomycetota bacterium]|nr:AAA family ATPase [Actinomycetota bacterium]